MGQGQPAHTVSIFPAFTPTFMSDLPTLLVHTRSFYTQIQILVVFSLEKLKYFHFFFVSFLFFSGNNFNLASRKKRSMLVLCSENTSPENSSVKTTQTSLSLSSHFLRLVSSDQYLSALYYFGVVDGFSNVQ